MLIEGPASVVQQFFRHYGHLRRDDRWRETISILLVYAFVLYFPAGLVSLLWMNQNVQYQWLGYMLYATLAMHITRVLGWTGLRKDRETVGSLA
jgi:hypothetical protein